MAQVMVAVSKDATAMSTSKFQDDKLTLYEIRSPVQIHATVVEMSDTFHTTAGFWKPSASTVAKLGMLQLYVEWGGNPDLNSSDNWKRIHRRIY